MHWFKRKKVNPLVSDAVLAANDVEIALDAWVGSINEREVMNIVLARKLPGTSVRGNPYSVNPKSIYKGKVPFGITSHGKLESGG